METGLAYDARGEGEAILFIHGSFIEDALLPVIEEPALDGYRRIHYERRAYGDSDPHEGTVLIEREAEDALSVLRHLGIDEAHVVGYSYGGVIAFELARSAPATVQSVVLIEPPLPLEGADADGPPPFVVESVQRYQEGDADAAIDAFFRGISGPTWRDEIGGTVEGAEEQVYRNAPHFFERELPGLQTYTIDAAVAADIRQPLLYVVSSDGPPMHDALLELLRAWIPTTEALRITDADHTVPMQRPGALANAIARFIER